MPYKDEEKRKEHQRKYHKDYWAKNKEKLARYSHEYYLLHKERYYNSNKKRRLSGKDKYIKKSCLLCEKEFDSSRRETKYCSRKCARESKKLNRPKKCAWCGKEFYVSVSQEKLRNRKCCSRKCGSRYNVKFRSGENSNFWRGGVSLENRKQRYSFSAREWRESVFKRDDYTCQRCKKRGTYLHAHHIKKWSEYPELRFEISNGLTLCRECHKHEHSKKNK